MEKYSAQMRSRLMEDETSIRAVMPCPGGGHIVTLGFPGLSFDIRGDAFIDPERLNATLSAAALDTCRLLIVLVEKQEVAEDAWPLLQAAVEKRSGRMVHLPIKDYEAPDTGFITAWEQLSEEINDILADGATVAISCHYGAGRSGTVAASMLIERGKSLQEAIDILRSEFEESIESEKQLTWLCQVEIAAR